MEKETLLTQEGLAKLKEELEEYITVRRPKNSERLQIAISYGDISENSEYDSAKEEQSFIEGHILDLQKMIKNAKIIDESKKRKTRVEVGATVTLEDLAPEDDDDKEQIYTVVGTAETDPASGKISNESPIGAAIMGKKVGDTVTVRTPVGDHQYKIRKIK